MKNRIKYVLARAKKNRQKVFCAYVTLGYPSLAFTRKLIQRMEALGVDLIELGFPFSDPLADGPVIQRASEHALRKKVVLADALALVQRLRKNGSEIPLIFFSYYNPIHHYGPRRFAQAIARSGFDGVICPDLPPEEDATLPRQLAIHGLAMIYLASPTTAQARLQLVGRRSSGFIYYVSLKGVTGIRKKLSSDLKAQVSRIKRVHSKPVLIGFGVSGPDHVREACRISDGVVVGSAIVDSIGKSRGNIDQVSRFVRHLVLAARR